MINKRKITIGTINFRLNKSKMQVNGLCPIQMRYSYKGKIVAFSLGESILIENWDEDMKCPLYLSKPIAKKIRPDLNYSLFASMSDVNSIISKMVELELDIKEIESEILYVTKEISTDEVIDRLKIKRGLIKPNEDKVYFTEFMRKYIVDNDKRLLHSTKVVYQTIINMVEDFESKRAKRYEIGEIGFNYIKNICDYMVTDLKLINSTIFRRLKLIKGFVNKARKQGFKIDSTYLDFTWKDDDSEVIALTMDELNRIAALALDGNIKLQKVRDVFLFSCYTGLRYSDCKNLKKVNIKEGFLRITSIKTKSSVSVPISKRAKELIDKYYNVNNDLLFPVPSNQKFNDYIKQVCELAGLNEMIEKVRFRGSERLVEVLPKFEFISAHTGRKTFVTLSLELGMKAEEVMPITGHKDYKSFKRYVNLTEQRAKEALLSAWEK